ncbi:hypothetical protein BB559_007533, partial [Furculomyces boomerangus]
LFDLVRPAKEGLITLKDIYNMNSNTRPVFFDAFMNLSRFCEHENRSSMLQKQLAQYTHSLDKGLNFEEIIAKRVEFLNSAPTVWVEFADAEYEALILDQQQQQSENKDDDSSEF